MKFLFNNTYIICVIQSLFYPTKSREQSRSLVYPAAQFITLMIIIVCALMTSINFNHTNVLPVSNLMSAE